MTIERLLTAALRRHLAGAPLRIPEPGRLVWGWFADLSAARSYGFGPNPISYSDILAYAALNSWPMEGRHVALIRALDVLWLEHARASPARSQTTPRSSGQSVTPDAFDVMFG